VCFSSSTSSGSSSTSSGSSSTSISEERHQHQQQQQQQQHFRGALLPLASPSAPSLLARTMWGCVGQQPQVL